MTTRGARIKEAREYWQSQGEGRSTLLLCELIGVTEPTYYNWEGDKVKEIYAGNLMKFCKVTGFHPTYITSGKRPKLIAEDEAMAELMAIVEDFTDAEFKDVVKYAVMVRNARPRKASSES